MGRPTDLHHLITIKTTTPENHKPPLHAQMAQAIASTAKAVGIGVGSLSIIAYLALWGGQRQVTLPLTSNPLILCYRWFWEKSWRILQISLLDHVQRYRTRMTSTVLPMRIYISRLRTEKNFMRLWCCKILHGIRRRFSFVMQMLGIWVIESPFVRNYTKAMGGMYSFSRIGGKTCPFSWG